jgi:hypothetical protein
MLASLGKGFFLSVCLAGALALPQALHAASSGISICTATGKVGLATGLSDEYAAGYAAIDDCVQRGGIPDCCASHVLTSSAGCIAIARGESGFAFGQGEDPVRAVGDAIIKCQLDTQNCIAMGHLCE